MIIYKITNKVNKKVYIGKTVRTITRRFNTHKNRCVKGDKKYLYNAMRYYGINNFIIETIDIANDIQELNTKEIFWIKKLQSNNKLYGYNQTNGGDGGDTWRGNHHKELTSKRLSNSISNSIKHKLACNTPEYKSKISKIRKGKKLSKEQINIIRQVTINRFKDPEERKKMSLVHKNKPLSIEHRLKIGLYNKGKKLSNVTKLKISLKNKGKRKGKTWEEIFGYDKAQEMKVKLVKRLKKRNI
jgi:group I intron endonuclease